jgi:hypothetical protein
MVSVMILKGITMIILQWNENYVPPSYAQSLNPRRDHELNSEKIFFVPMGSLNANFTTHPTS